ncbi:MAG: sulfotransferase domain-containing protein [Chloroflexi bacterium]|nr:sulfotransferase domain-containing protein [Chloroflexota bacterium]
MVLHLQRHNLLRVLVSLKIAEETGIYFQHGGWRARSLAMIAGLSRRLFSGRAQPARPKVTISPDEFRQEAMAKAMTAKHWEEILAGHQIFSVSYEDMTPDPQEEFARAQSFLGVTPSKLRVAFVRQNPQKLEELIENYTELRDAFLGGPAEWMFSD